IVGSWLPGFVLLPLIGMERTLHVGIALNMLLALGLLIAGAAEPDAAEAGSEGEQAKPAAPRKPISPLVSLIVPLAILAGAAAAAYYAVGDDSAIRGALGLGTGATTFLIVGLWALLRV